jgi:NAD(P)-dependent dehydrogenase (short-subunit alcohol dehydrogenase family)
MHPIHNTLLALILVAPLATLAESPPALAASTASQKAVLVTGASTGIGRKVTERLAANGYFVYAGARKEADLKALAQIKNVQALRLDVTSTADIAAAVETIQKAGRGLYGLVNNAGIATRGTLAEMPPEEFDLTMQVNLYGPYRVSRAFAPMIIAAKGRITTIGSISGIGVTRDLMAYQMSKHAVEAFTDSLAMQMQEQGVIVNVVEPGNYNSEIMRSALRRLNDTKSSGDRSQYKEPDEVAEAVEKALFEPNPKRRYLVVPNQGEAEWAIGHQIRQLVQLNEDQPYTYDRDALIKMLDEALAKARPKTK